MVDDVQNVPLERANKVCGEFDGPRAERRQASKPYWRRYLEPSGPARGEVQDGSGTDSE